METNRQGKNMRRNYKKKGIALFTTAVMGVLAPFSGVVANAEETVDYKISNQTFEDAKNNPTQAFNGVKYDTTYDEYKFVGGTYKLTEDINYGAAEGGWHWLSSKMDGVSIDLNGKTLGAGLRLDADGENSSLVVTGNGTVVNSVGVYNGATATIDGGSYKSGFSLNESSNIIVNNAIVNSEAYGIQASNGSNITINNIEVDSDLNSIYIGEGDLTINGGTFLSDKEAVYVIDGGKVSVSGGTIQGVGGIKIEKAKEFDVSGGSFTNMELSEVEKMSVIKTTVQFGFEAKKMGTLDISGGRFGYMTQIYQSKEVSISGGKFENPDYFALIESSNESFNISGGTFTGNNGGYVGASDSTVLTGGTFTATATESDDPISGIICYCEGEEKSKTVFDDILAEGYEYSPQITPAYEPFIVENMYCVYTDQKSFSVIKTPDAPDDPDTPDDPDDPDDPDTPDTPDTPDDPDTPDNPDEGKDEKKSDYSNEWVDGKWYGADGKCTYDGILSWKQNATGWWVEDTKGWYAQNSWQKIDGKWYYFLADGYMDYSEYRDGCWLGADGAWVEEYYGGHWMSDSTGWWYADSSGWYPQNQWLWVDGSCYYFGSDGYMLTSQYVDGCWVGDDGAWIK